MIGFCSRTTTTTFRPPPRIRALLKATYRNDRACTMRTIGGHRHRIGLWPRTPPAYPPSLRRRRGPVAAAPLTKYGPARLRPHAAPPRRRRPVKCRTHLADAPLIEPAWAALNRAPGWMALLPARLAHFAQVHPSRLYRTASMRSPRKGALTSHTSPAPQGMAGGGGRS